MSFWDSIEQQISASIGQRFQLEKHASVLGGDINQANRIEGNVEGEAVSFFIKLNQKNRLAMFEAEAAGLEEIERSQSIYVPHVICTGTDANQSYIILENLALGRLGHLGHGAENSAALLGQQLAQMHQVTANQFGWMQDNTIGSTRQVNTQTDSWLDFWREYRLGFQLELAMRNGASRSLKVKGKQLLDELDKFFIDYSPRASLVHGDLWSGNFGYLKSGEPVIYDPAVYYGDRETDIAMTELFGGFPNEFYSAYNETWILDKGYQQRKTLYNLYHILNHYNLFGGGYAMQAEDMIERLLVL